MSILFTFNLISILLFLNITIEILGKNRFKFIFIFFVLLNWLYFLRKDNYLKIIENPPVYKNKFLSTILVVLYVLISIVLFFSALDMNTKYLIFTLVALSLVMIVAWALGTNNKSN
jgi:hypothetical protein